jgi:hypothetical protein
VIGCDGFIGWVWNLTKNPLILFFLTATLIIYRTTACFRSRLLRATQRLTFTFGVPRGLRVESVLRRPQAYSLHRGH